MINSKTKNQHSVSACNYYHQSSNFLKNVALFFRISEHYASNIHICICNYFFSKVSLLWYFLLFIFDGLPAISDIGHEFWSQHGHNSIKQRRTDCSLLSQQLWFDCSEGSMFFYRVALICSKLDLFWDLGILIFFIL